jgi:uncharacterized integral membrane protein
MIRLILFIVVVFLLYTLSFTNAQERVVIHYFWGWESNPVRIDLLILGSFLAGTLLAVIFTFPGWISMKLAIRRSRRTIEEIESERDRLRAQQFGGDTEKRPPFLSEDDPEEP